MKPLLIGATFGWVSTSVFVGMQGKANIGTMLFGLIIAVLWLALIASGIEARQGGDAEGGSVHESPAPQEDAPNPGEPTP